MALNRLSISTDTVEGGLKGTAYEIWKFYNVTSAIKSNPLTSYTISYAGYIYQQL